MPILEAPGGLQPQVLAHQHLIGVALEGAGVHELAELDVGAAVAQVVESLGNRGQEAGALAYHVGALAARRVVAHDPLPFLGVRHFLDVDHHIGAEPLGELQPPGGPADGDQPSGAGASGPGDRQQPDRSGALNHYRVAELDTGAGDAVVGAGRRLGEHRDRARQIGLEEHDLGIPEIDVLAEAAAQVGRLLGGSPAHAFTGGNHHAVADLHRVAGRILADAGPERIERADVLVPEDDLETEALKLPVVQVGAADAAQLLLDQDPPRLNLRHRILANVEFPARHHAGACRYSHVESLLSVACAPQRRAAVR